METVKLLNEIFPYVITDIIYDYVMNYRKEWTTSLKKDVLTQIKRCRGGRYYTHQSEFNRIRKSLNAMHENDKAPKDGKPHCIRHMKKLDSVHLEMTRKFLIRPHILRNHIINPDPDEWRHLEFFYLMDYKEQILSNILKLGYKKIHNRPNVKLCKKCYQIKPQSEYQCYETIPSLGRPFLNGTIRAKQNMCIPCIREHRKEIRTPKSKKPTGINRLPIEIQNEIRQMYASGDTIRKISEHFESRVGEFPLLKYASLCRLKRLGQMDTK